MEQPVPPEDKKRLSTRILTTIVVVVVILASILGVLVAHHVALSNSLSPSSVILNQSDVQRIIPNSYSFLMPQIPTGNNFDALDFTPGNPLPVFGGPVTSPNLVIFILENSSSQSALSGYNYLKSRLNSILPAKIENGNLSTFQMNEFPYPYITFFNSTHGTGALVTALFNYIVIVGVYDSSLFVLKQASSFQINKINDTVQYDQTNYLL